MSEIAKLVSDAPPGEVDAVRQDIEEFSGRSSAVSRALATELAAANVAQLRVVDVAGSPTVLSPHNRLGDSEFYTHGSEPQRFEVDHVTRKTRVLGSHKVEESESEPEREPEPELRDLQRAITDYAAQHYPAEHVAAVFATERDDEFAVVIVGRRLSPQNFFNGQLTAEYIVKNEAVRGSIKADVHYFEEGNVRLKSSTDVDTRAKQSGPAGVAAAIEKAESDFERSLNKTLVGLNEREFKALRRQLPVTRQPMQWGKAIAGYKLGSELQRA